MHAANAKVLFVKHVVSTTCRTSLNQMAFFAQRAVRRVYHSQAKESNLRWKILAQVFYEVSLIDDLYSDLMTPIMTIYMEKR